jgi:hypothetical protein
VYGGSGCLAANHAPVVLRQSDLRAQHLLVAGLAAQLLEQLVELGHSRRTDRVPFREQSAVCVNRDAAAEFGHAIVDEARCVATLQNPCGVPKPNPCLGEQRVANQDRRMPAEDRKPAAYHAEGQGLR